VIVKGKELNMKISIRKLARGSTGPRGESSDLYMSKVVNTGRKLGLSVRLSKKSMDALRWRAGDRVLIDFDRESETATLTLTRTESEEDGLRISAVGKTGAGQVRASLGEDHISSIFPNGKAGYYGQLINAGNRAGEFLIDYADGS